MVRQQEKAPHRRLDDMRREEDRRMAEREQVANHSLSSATPPPIAAKRRHPLRSWNACESVAMGAGSQRSFECLCVGEPCSMCGPTFSRIQSNRDVKDQSARIGAFFFFFLVSLQRCTRSIQCLASCMHSHTRKHKQSSKQSLSLPLSLTSISTAFYTHSGPLLLLNLQQNRTASHTDPAKHATGAVRAATSF